jgi:surfactin synthase thioesterase subunit
MKGWLRFEPSDARLAVLCLPHAGGGAGSFNRWLDLFPPDIAPVRVQLPGREDLADERPLELVDEVVGELTAQIVRRIDLPVVLYGHSLGALIAFELCYALAAAGIPPSHMFVSGRRAPHRNPRRDPIHQLPDGDFVLALEAMGGTIGSRNPAFLRYAIPLVKADLTMSEGYVYRPRPRMACPVDAFFGTGDPIVDADEIEAWGEHTDGEFTIHTYPGDHFFHQLNRAAIAATIAERVNRRAGQAAAH